VTKELPEAAEIRTSLELLGVLLADVRTDTSVASRDLQISDASFVRLRRAIDGVACAQSLLESTGAGSVGRAVLTLRVDPKLRLAAEGVLHKGESLPEFMEAALRESIARRRFSE
jgi:hypothetical protein